MTKRHVPAWTAKRWRCPPPTSSPSPSPAQLAFTAGPETVPLAIMGGLFVGTGILAVLAARKKQHLPLA